MADGLDEQDWKALREAGTEQDAPPGQVLVREGATGGSLFVILSGTVAITRGGRRVGGLGEGDLFGEVALLEGGARTASAIVEQDARVLVVPASAVRALFDSRPALRDRMLREAEARLLA
ncbi:MAG: Crp/Fnr family transcriptional regulator [Gaiellales bacterium]